MASHGNWWKNAKFSKIHKIDKKKILTQNKKMCCVSARRFSIHKTYNKFKNKFAE
jgi:hypothetical protein